MTDAPERIWRVKPMIPDDYQHGMASWPDSYQAGTGATEYVRADIHAALEAEMDRYKAALEDIAGPRRLISYSNPSTLRINARATLQHDDGE